MLARLLFALALTVGLGSALTACEAPEAPETEEADE